MLFLYLVASLATSRLIKVAVLARHGNRAPNPQVPYICPNAKAMIDQFREPVGSKLRAALSRVGMAENLEAGAFLKGKYVGKGKLLKDETYFDDGSTFFLSERMNRNIVSTVALTRGMYPAGTGQKGFEAANPNLVPIITSQPFADTLMNLPRDGPCKSRYNADRKKWTATHEAKVLSEHASVIRELSRHCGFDFAKTHERTKKSLVWSLKATADLFSFATNEGIDASMGGQIPTDFQRNISTLTKGLVNDERFGKAHQITYWIGRFLDDAIFQNLRDPDHKKKQIYDVDGVKTSSKAPWVDTPSEWYHQNKFLLFLNHRELLISVLKVFALEKVLEDTPPSGSMLLWEVHEDHKGQFIRFLFWKPSQPSFEAKAKKLKSGEPVADLYSTGHVEEVFPNVCHTKGRCVLSELEAAFKAWVSSTGTWAEVCNLTKDETLGEYLAEVESAADDGDDQDGWRAAFENSLFGVVLNVSSLPPKAWELPSLPLAMIAGVALFVCLLTCRALTWMRDAREARYDLWHYRHFSHPNLI
eukprot:GEMP01036856.1.p1 GENE.GEMP01036856.1~~GEMP01036856.1.p1  ORF type:complete len:531 (+),score=93.45 GEMP01036856.1:110-1702(+)